MHTARAMGATQWVTLRTRASLPRGASATVRSRRALTRAGMNFGHEDFFDVVGTERDLTPEERFPDLRGTGRGLTRNQIEALGLAGDEAKERFSVKAWIWARGRRMLRRYRAIRTNQRGIER